MLEEKDLQVINEERKELPVIALRGKVFFPHTFLNFDVGRPVSVAAVDVAVSFGSEIFIAPQNNVFIDAPKKSDICPYGVVAKIKQTVRHSQGTIKLNVEGLYRAKIVEFKETKNYFSAIVERAEYIPSIFTKVSFRSLRTARRDSV